MTQISTHVLDIGRGVQAAGVRVELLAAAALPQMVGGWLLAEGEGWNRLGLATTDADGRAEGLAGPGGAGPGRLRLVFFAGEYQRRLAGDGAFLDEVSVSFTVTAEEERLHIPLLLSPYGVSIYRGS